MPLILMHGIDKKKLVVQLFSKLFGENLHKMACKKPIATYVATPTSSRNKTIRAGIGNSFV